jgi:uncharacterized protein with PIN domain
VRLLCDEMLLRLGRWLRAAGYDIEIAAGGLADTALVARCADEKRVLLTCDRHLAARADGVVPVVRFGAEGIEAQARKLNAALGIDWTRAPFSRCLVDDAPLDPAPAEAADRVPPDSRAAGGPLLRCPECGRSTGRAGMSAVCGHGWPRGRRTIRRPSAVAPRCVQGQAPPDRGGGLGWPSSAC